MCRFKLKTEQCRTIVHEPQATTKEHILGIGISSDLNNRSSGTIGCCLVSGPESTPGGPEHPMDSISAMQLVEALMTERNDLQSQLAVISVRFMAVGDAWVSAKEQSLNAVFSNLALEVICRGFASSTTACIPFLIHLTTSSLASRTVDRWPDTLKCLSDSTMSCLKRV